MSHVQEVKLRLTECITARLQSVLGESVKEVIFKEFKKKNGLSSEEIPNRPGAFDAFLKGFFGDFGSRFIENILIEEIRRNFSIPGGCFSFESILNAANAN